VNVVLWIVTIVLAIGFLAAGTLKVVRTREQLGATGMGWAADFSPGMVKLIGAAESLGAIGLVLPALVDVAPTLVPIAAAALAVVMIGAVVTHVRRHEVNLIAPSAVLLVLSLFVAIFRFGPNAF
jgi:uncharacterized membrane protein YphA (DoxX/SURF4 family)